jgi:hypothetical protein
MNQSELKKKYDRIINDVDFDKLELGLKNPNIFQILRISKNEIRHSNFLSWLLNPNESHKLGDIFLKRFLREVFSSDKFDEIDQVHVEGMDLTKVEIIREWKNIDILIKLPNVIVCIENKVLSKEHSNQLTRYKKTIESTFPDHKRTYVYLNPEGDFSLNETESYHPISYELIIEILERILIVYEESTNSQVVLYIKDYITIIKRELMNSDELTELSNRIYKNHKELFDFIYERRPQSTDKVREILIELVKKKGWILGSESKHYVRFLTPRLKDYIYINKTMKNGWKKNETFLFEIPIQPNSNKIGFKTVISPSDELYNSKRLSEILLEIKGFKKPIGQKWLVNYSKNDVFDFENTSEESYEEIYSQLVKFMNKYEDIVNKVENKLLEYSEELMNMKKHE